ncbi:MAG: YebC/PmpR family DNA-binding transcriptional regulator [Candidatus Aureabacteria bacterium]|nr:YebC/PmpR family DNA-binding transcriptional regulator [Candidatus Auribacterota bacterium]
MSGHSKWASIKHKKGALDAKRGQIFSKIVREISVAARAGGGDPDSNPRLRAVILNAKAVNMPSDNVEKAIKKGTGELPGVSYEEVAYEGYGPGGVAIMVNCLSDNKNRTASEIRNIFDKKNGHMGGAGSVAWNFIKKGMITVDKKVIDEEKLFSIALEAGAEDFSAEEKDVFEIYTVPDKLEGVKRALDGKGIKYSVAEISLVPKSTIRVAGKEAHQLLELMGELEDHDDVQSVSSNFDIPDEILEEVEKQ